MTTVHRLPNIHPGEILEEEFLVPHGITKYRLAKDIGVPATRIAEICAGRRALTADTALRLSAYFGVSAKFWLGLQDDYDLEDALGHGVRKKFKTFPDGTKRFAQHKSRSTPATSGR